MLRPAHRSPTRRVLGLALGFATALTATMATAAQAPETAAAMVSAPVWVRMPKAGDITRVYPLSALQQGRAGGATLDCRIDTRGLLNSCAVLNEAPARSGFGQAALALAPAFQIADTDQDGLATRGARVAIPIRFVAPTQTGSRLRSVGY